MDEDRNMRLAELQERIGRGEYHVDAQAVAAAIVRRLQERSSVLLGPNPAQRQCS